MSESLKMNEMRRVRLFRKVISLTGISPFITDRMVDELSTNEDLDLDLAELFIDTLSLFSGDTPLDDAEGILNKIALRLM